MAMLTPAQNPRGLARRIFIRAPFSFICNRPRCYRDFPRRVHRHPSRSEVHRSPCLPPPPVRAPADVSAGTLRRGRVEEGGCLTTVDWRGHHATLVAFVAWDTMHFSFNSFIGVRLRVRRG